MKTAARFLKNPGQFEPRIYLNSKAKFSTGLISLGGGLPSAEYFPFEHLDIKVPTAPGFTPEETKKSGTVLRAGKHDIQEGTSTYG